MSRKKYLGVLVGLAVIAFGMMRSHNVRASDHDDGENDQKSRSLNLTDLYVFREDAESMTPAGDKTNLVYVMNTHPRSLPNQQYYYSEKARYEFHIGRAASKSAAITTSDNVTMRFEFGPTDANFQQTITMTTIRDGVSTVTTADNAGNALRTTAAYGATGATVVAKAPKVMDLTVNGSAIKLFAGHRADPFFFNVTGFFKMRLAAANAVTQSDYVAAAANNYLAAAGPTPLGDDFTKNYNVSSIVVRMPIAWLQATAADTTFDSWTSISIPQ